MGDFWSQGSFPTARKNHRCSICNRQIDIGESYFRGAGVYDGMWSTWKQCNHCKAISQMFDVSDGEGLISEESFGWWADEGTYVYPPRESTPESELRDIQELRYRVQFKRRWRRNDGALYPVPS